MTGNHRITNNVLEKIVSDKQDELVLRKENKPVSDFKEQLVQSDRSLHKALALPGNRFIMEYKKASPSRGDIRPDLSPLELLSAYQKSADAISVLTDKKYFNGSHENLAIIRENTDKPVLCKDFFIDEYQLYEARYFGADAVLLMLSVLNDETYLFLHQIADSLSLDVLTEVHTPEEAQRAVDLNSKIIGINNRDLRTLTTDLTTTETIVQCLPEDRLMISESGIESREDVARLAKYVDGFLVGSSLMASKDIQQAATSLVYGCVKICGVKDQSIARQVIQSGGSYIGFMFYKPSPRAISLSDARELVLKISEEQISEEPVSGEKVSENRVLEKYVGVFVNASHKFILECIEACHLTAVQCHGDESLDDLQTLKQQLPQDVELWKAIALKNADDLSVVNSFNTIVDRFVFDCRTEDVYGGSGQSFDWSLIPLIRKQLQDDTRIIIAGGIQLDNIHRLFQYPNISLDISSGVESDKGVKCPQKIKALFEYLRTIGEKNE